MAPAAEGGEEGERGKDEHKVLAQNQHEITKWREGIEQAVKREAAKVDIMKGIVIPRL